MKKFFAKIFNKEELKNRLPLALLAGSAFPFMFFLFGVLEIYAGNRGEMWIPATEFIGYLILMAVGAAIVFSALILFLPKTGALITVGVLVWLALMGYVQSLFLNTTGSLSMDSGEGQGLTIVIIDTIIWAVTGVVIIAAAMLIDKKDIIKKIFLVGLVALIVMQTASCASRIGDITRYVDKFNTSEETTGEEGTATETDTGKTPDETQQEQTNPDYANAYLTEEGLTSVSKGKNVVVFIVDRFDVSFYEDMIKKDEKYFNTLDGFTYFSDNISLYSRTWPAIATMISGIDNDFSTTPNEYFEKAYTESPFLNDLKANGYHIKLYMPGYYCYREGTPLVGLADNISVATGYKIKSRGALVGNLLALSAYRYVPNIFKDSIYVASSAFTEAVELKGGAPEYKVDDPAVCGQIIENGLSFDSDGDSFILIHLQGCHTPSNMDANAERIATERKDMDGSREQLQGCFKTINFYLDEMKRLGVYDDATVIITGDHPRARDDKKDPSQPRLTALFVKPAGATGELKHSSAQVSQENFIPTIVKSAGIKTEYEYGRSYFEVPEGEDNVRYHKFELSGSPNQIVKYKVTGCGDVFDNWQVESRQNVENFYK